MTTVEEPVRFSDAVEGKRLLHVDAECALFDEFDQPPQGATGSGSTAMPLKRMPAASTCESDAGLRARCSALSGLSRGPVRHDELIEVIGGISRKVLTQTLRRLESHGLRRNAYTDGPPRVEYELTPVGETLIDPIHVPTEWTRGHGDAVLDALGHPTVVMPAVEMTKPRPCAAVQVIYGGVAKA